MTKTKYKKIAAILISSLSAVLINSLITLLIPDFDNNLSVVFVAIIAASIMGEFWPDDFQHIR
ncbi:hypothetical protein [Alteromonas lipotrueiana]|uniref:hypothetical protein n=1 Tax=Alteromonas lipotrueiana TaxID=2803815 RepID=UPI001C484754|nr:hypothetical protein [Alteromonas lipotrueiana]